MSYRKIYFRIRTEGYSSGWSSDADRAAFKEESRRLFQELGWTVTLGCNGGCDTVAKDRAELESKRDKITGYILEKCRTKRSNLYITDPVAIHVAEHFKIRRLCDKDGRNQIGHQFVTELMDHLLQKGWLVSAKTFYGDGIRTATPKERGVRQSAAQVEGQITIGSQGNNTPKRKKGRKPTAPSL